MNIIFRVHNNGSIYYIERSVAVEHPPEVHEAMGTESEQELQAALDQVRIDDYYDENGNHRGLDQYGFEMIYEDDIPNHKPF